MTQVNRRRSAQSGQAGRTAGAGRSNAAAPVRERLLDAADSLLFIEGAFATPVDAILRHAAASPPSLYSHFGNKEGLIAAALRRRLEIWTQVWDAQIVAAQDDAGRIMALWNALATYQSERMQERWCAFSGTAAAIVAPGDELRAVLDAETAQLRERLLHYSRPVAGERAPQLASALAVTYAGTMALMLREPWDTAIAEGAASARTLIEAFGP